MFTCKVAAVIFTQQCRQFQYLVIKKKKREREGNWLDATISAQLAGHDNGPREHVSTTVHSFPE